MKFYNTQDDFISFYQKFCEDRQVVLNDEYFDRLFSQNKWYSILKDGFDSRQANDDRIAGISPRAFEKCLNDSIKRLRKQIVINHKSIGFKCKTETQIIPFKIIRILNFDFIRYEIEIDTIGTFHHISHIASLLNRNCSFNLFNEPPSHERDLFLLAIICYIHVLILEYGTSEFKTFLYNIRNN